MATRRTSIIHNYFREICEIGGLKKMTNKPIFKTAQIALSLFIL